MESEKFAATPKYPPVDVERLGTCTGDFLVDYFVGIGSGKDFDALEKNNNAKHGIAGQVRSDGY